MRELQTLIDVKKAPNKYVDTTGDTMTGELTFTNNVNPIKVKMNITGGWARGLAYENASGERLGTIGIYGTDNTSNCAYMGVVNDAYTGNNSFKVTKENCYFNNHKIWHAGNDGAGSGLDADLIDGINSEKIIFGDNGRGTLDLGTGGANDILKSGFYRPNSANAANNPLPENIHSGIIHMQHPTMDNYASQIAMSYNASNKIHFRTKTNSSNWNAWYKIYHAGDKPTWNEILNKPSSFPPSSHNHGSITISDIRGTNPTPGQLESSTITTFFNDQYGDGWRSGITVKGWSGEYCAWQLGSAASTSAGETLSFRSGIGTTWNPWRRIYHEGYKPTPSAIGALALSGGTMSGEINLNSNQLKLTNSVNGYPRLGFDSSTTDVYLSNANNNWLRLKADTTMTFGGYKVYTAKEKPTPSEIGALGKTEKAVSASDSDSVNGRVFKWEFGTGNPTHIWGSSGSSTNMQVWAPNNITVGRATSAGSADSVAWANITGKPGTYSPSSHTHDDRYFTESEINGMITESATASKLVKRDSAGDINCRLLRSNYSNQSTISGAIAFRTNNSTDNYVRFCSDTTAIRNWIGAAASNHSHSLPTAAQLGAMKMTRMGSSAGDYYIMGDIYGSDDCWLRTTQPGLLPYSPGTSRLGDIGQRYHTIYGINGDFDKIKVNGTGGQILMNGSLGDSGDICLGWDNKVMGRISMLKGSNYGITSTRWLKIAVADENDKEDVLMNFNAEGGNWIIHSASLCGQSDNSRDLGSPNYRYKKVYSAGGVATSSDEKMKQNIKYIDKKPKATRSKRNTVNLMAVNNEKDLDNFEIKTNDCYNFIKDTPYATYFYKKKVRSDASTEECENADKNGTLLIPSSDDFMVGFIAQDIAKTKVGKMFLDYYEETGYNYNLNNYVGIIAKALQEAMNKIEALESQLIKK